MSGCTNTEAHQGRQYAELRCPPCRCCRPEKYTIKPERKEIAAVSIDLTRHDDFQGPRKLEVSPATVRVHWAITSRLEAAEDVCRVAHGIKMMWHQVCAAVMSKPTPLRPSNLGTIIVRGGRCDPYALQVLVADSDDEVVDHASLLNSFGNENTNIITPVPRMHSIKPEWDEDVSDVHIR